ncbi:MAG: B12-binding domain-containing radical SAM protein [Endomicrobiales bacterium]|nr:B12-binding domain-containing radical SAM protein [Endomicrobiales bacterium]
MLNILLIKPKWFINGDVYKFRDLNRVAPLNLGIIAALSQEHNVRIIDEDIEEITYSSDWDLVGITVVTFTAKRAYEISTKFRKAGVKTVLGGPHPSIIPEEASNYCDSVVIGEAEPVWQKLLNDLEKKELKKVYNGNYSESLDNVPIPRRDLFAKKHLHAPIQFTRGCVNSCYFCYLQSVPWKNYRKRTPERIYEEISRINDKYVFVIDDNLFVDKEYVKDVMKKITPLKKKWFVQSPVSIAKEEEMLDLMAEAGCYAVSMGFQSINQDTLDLSNISHNRVNEYKKTIETMHKKGILVDGFFMFGFDNDDKSTFSCTAEMIKEMNLDDAILYILTPYPGTQLFKHLNEEKRILNYDWSKYSWYNCNFKPKNMTAGEVKEGLKQVYEDLNNHFRMSFPKRIWDHRRLIFKDVKLSVVIMKNYLNRVDAESLP